MIGDLLADHLEPSAVGQITRGVLDRGFDYPSTVAEHIAPYAHRFGLSREDGWGMLDYLLSAAGAIETRQWVIGERQSAAVR
jgi:hypothetical protein